MPPRISPRPIAQTQHCQCFRTRPRESTSESTSSRAITRQFHATPPNATRLRRNMYAWLKGPGKVFRDPLPKSSNYLSAYDKSGRLLRARQDEREQREQDDAELDEPEESLVARDQEEGFSDAEVAKRSGQRERRRLEKQEMDERGGIPKERAQDLRPYPLNPSFRSQPVLSQQLREKIHELVIDGGADLKSVSGALGVDIRRVAAVVRLMSLEKQWIEEGKPLAKPYNDAVLAMLPQTTYRENQRNPPAHESINDVPVHPHTRQQMFVPASESRAFTRDDAAKAFHPKLLPADKRIPHPELLQATKWELQGLDRETRIKLIQEKDEEHRKKAELQDRKQAEWQRRTQLVVPGRRWDFKFQNISVEKAGKDGRGRNAVGLRYGMPLEDRKKGQIKIPTKVE